MYITSLSSGIENKVTYTASACMLYKSTVHFVFCCCVTFDTMYSSLSWLFSRFLPTWCIFFFRNAAQCSSCYSIQSPDSHCLIILGFVTVLGMAFWFCLCSIYYLLLLVPVRRRHTHTHTHRNGFPGLLGESLLSWTWSYLLSRFIHDCENRASRALPVHCLSAQRDVDSEKQAPIMWCSAPRELD